MFRCQRAWRDGMEIDVHLSAAPTVNRRVNLSTVPAHPVCRDTQGRRVT